MVGLAVHDEREKERVRELTNGGEEGVGVNPATCLANRVYAVSPLPSFVRRPRILELDDVLQLYGRFGIRFYCYRIKRPPRERPLNIDGPARTI